MATQRTHRELAPRYAVGESPRDFGQRVPLGDQKTLALELTAKLLWSCGSGSWSFASAKS